MSSSLHLSSIQDNPLAIHKINCKGHKNIENSIVNTYKLVFVSFLSHWEFAQQFSSAMYSPLGHSACAAVGFPVGV